MNKNVFICFSKTDYEKVKIVRNQLEDWFLNPIIIRHLILDDNEIDALIKKSIDACHYYVLCDSKNARESIWVNREIEYIKTKGGKIEIVDVEKSDVDIKLFSDTLGRLIAKTEDGANAKKKGNEDNKIFVFLSHSHHDYEKVRFVRDLLETEGFRPLMFFLKC